MKKTSKELKEDIKRDRKGRKIAKTTLDLCKKTGQHPLMLPHPHNFTRISMSESTFYELAVMALRYSMGGHTIATDGIIGDIIDIVGFSSLTARIASCFCRDYEQFIEDRTRWHKDSDCTPELNERWDRSYEWFRSFRDNDFHILTISGKIKGKTVTEQHLCFKWKDRFIEAELFRRNNIAVAYVDPSTIKGDLAHVSWRWWVDNKEEL